MAEARQQLKEEDSSDTTCNSIPVDSGASDLNNSGVIWVDSHPECSVCLQPCLQPVQLPCQHVFCFLCLKGFAFRSKKCALCRDEVKLEYFDKPVVVRVKNTSSPENIEEKYDWFYEGRNGWWQYDERASMILEEAYKSEARSCEILIAGFLYLVNFEDMIQFRKSHPSRRRRIKRDKVGVDRKGIAGLKIRSKPNAETDSTSSHQLKDSTTITEKKEVSLQSPSLTNSSSTNTAPAASSTTHEIENDLSNQLGSLQT